MQLQLFKVATLKSAEFVPPKDTIKCNLEE